MRGLH